MHMHRAFLPAAPDLASPCTVRIGASVIETFAEDPIQGVSRITCCQGAANSARQQLSWIEHLSTAGARIPPYNRRSGAAHAQPDGERALARTRSRVEEARPRRDRC